MKSLNALNKETIRLLNSNKLLKPLIQSEAIKNILEEVIIEKELEEEIMREFLEKYELNDQEKLFKWLNLNGLTELDLRNTALADIRLKRYCLKTFEHQIESWFLERKSKLDIFTYSMIRVKDYYKANELYLRIVENEEDIGNLASQFSEGDERKHRGVIGPASLDGAHPIMVEQLKNSQKGVVKPPFKIEDLFIVCRLEWHEPAKLDETIREKMSYELFNKSLEDQIQKVNKNLVNTLEKKEIIEVNS